MTFKIQCQAANEALLPHLVTTENVQQRAGNVQQRAGKSARTMYLAIMDVTQLEMQRCSNPGEPGARCHWSHISDERWNTMATCAGARRAAQSTCSACAIIALALAISAKRRVAFSESL